jgi:hypothetical protein
MTASSAYRQEAPQNSESLRGPLPLAPQWIRRLRRMHDPCRIQHQLQRPTIDAVEKEYPLVIFFYFGL